MYKKISSTILFILCLFLFSSAHAGQFSFLNTVYHLLLNPGPVSNLNIVKSGNGTGLVTSDTTINCGSECNEDFTEITVVSLIATPTAGSFFTGWSGNECSGINPKCVVQVDKTSSITVYAEFSLLPASFTESEFNNNYLSANIVTFNTPIRGSVDATSDTDWFAFSATGEETITIEFDFPLNPGATDGDDWHIQLYANNDFSSPLRDVYVNQGDTFNLNVPGDVTYYLVVSKDVSGTIIDYEFTIITGNNEPSETEVAITGTDDHLNAVPLAFDTEMHGNLNSIDDQDWFELQSGGSYVTATIEFAATSSVKDWIVTVYSAAGATGQVLARTAVGDGSVCKIGLPPSSAYYFVVTDLTSFGDFGGRPYTLTVRSTGGANVMGESEANDVIGDATPIDFATTSSLSGQIALSNIPGSADVVSDTDWFSFEGTAGTTVTFDFSSPETSNQVWWIVTIDEIIGSSTTLYDGQSMPVILPADADGTYHITVAPDLITPVQDKIAASAEYVITRRP